MKDACAEYRNADGSSYSPSITFIICQKRHKIRMFPCRREDCDNTGNPLSGTVVDSYIVDPNVFDFFLYSHAALKGTSVPAHYYTLYDDSNFSADQIQLLTYQLSYVYQRCMRSTSICAPAYYAHLAAYRARLYSEVDEEEYQSSESSSSSPSSRKNQPLEQSLSSMAAQAKASMSAVVGTLRQSLYYA